MKISGVVKMLVNDLAKFGDLEVVIVTTDDSGHYDEVPLKTKHFGYNLQSSDPKSPPMSLYIDGNTP